MTRELLFAEMIVIIVFMVFWIGIACIWYYNNKSATGKRKRYLEQAVRCGLNRIGVEVTRQYGGYYTITTEKSFDTGRVYAHSEVDHLFKLEVEKIEDNEITYKIV